MYEMSEASVSIAAMRHLSPRTSFTWGRVSFRPAPEIPVEMVDDLVEHVGGHVVLQRPGVDGGRRDHEIELLSEQHQLFGERHGILEEDDVVLHAVHDHQMVLEVLAEADRRYLPEHLRVRVGSP